MSSATGEFTVASWNEDTYKELEGGAKLTRASVTGSLTGDIVGTSETEWLMVYRPDGTANYVGLQRVDGSLGVNNGSFVVESNGVFNGGEAKGTWSVVAGSGTGDLAELTGEGTFNAPLGEKATISLDYSIG
ncbi:MAG: DUF3224 domain-containing protein [Actinomycetota bacterium]